MKIKTPELLAPAGSFDALKAAVYAGCDAVYLSGERFGARANAENFTNDTIPAAIDFAHIHGVKVYYAANTLIKEKEINLLLEQIRFLYKEGVDAFIIQDFGVYSLLKKFFPLVPIHASTQMTVHSLNGVTELQKLGFERVVLSRELSIEEIKHIINNSDVEIECFIHGALCFSYSGQCFMSSLIGGRSGNRGTCAQPCRLPYDIYQNNKRLNSNNDKYLLSPKDIQTLEILPDLIKSGIHSLKIEGRMKNANYVGLITSLYRKYIDLYLGNPNNYQVDDKDINKMLQIYNRGGFSKGYFMVKNGVKMMSLKRPNHQGITIGKVAKIEKNYLQLKVNFSLNQGDCLEIINDQGENYSFTVKDNVTKSIYKLYINNHKFKINDLVVRLTNVELNQMIEKMLLTNKNLKLNMIFKGKINDNMQLYISYKSFTVKVLGSVIEKARTSSISKDKLIAQLSKTAHEDFVVEHIELDVDEQIFISVKEINELRRKGINKLISTITDSSKRSDIKIQYNEDKNVNPLINNELNVLVRTKEQFNTVIKYDIDTVTLELFCFETEDILDMAKQCYIANIKLFIALPRIIRDNYIHVVEKRLKSLDNSFVSGIMLRSFDAYAFVNKKSFCIDYNVHVFNNEAINFWKKKGAKKIGVSTEQNKGEISKLKSNCLEMLVYGYVPLMVTTQCLYKNLYNSCSTGKSLILKDRKNLNFEVYRDCLFCYNTIYNTHKTVLLDKCEELNMAGIFRFRVDLLNESSKEVDEIMNYAMKLKNKEFFSTSDFEKSDLLKNYTRGHFLRGVK